MLGAFEQAVGIMLEPSNLLLLVAGTLFGLFNGIIPGLSGVTALVLLTPFTFGLSPEKAFILVLSAWVATSTGGAITSILLGVPGTSKAAAAVFDGYPLGQSGRAVEAIACQASASMLGGLFGSLVLLSSLPVLRRVVLLFGPPEFLFLIAWGLVTIGAVSGDSLLSGLISACLGLLLGFVGANPVLGGVRYTGGILYLWDGFSIGSVFLGLFALGTALEMARKRGTDADPRKPVVRLAREQTLKGFLAPFRHFWLTIRCAVVGAVVGVMPGAGGTVANFVSYSHAVQTSGDRSRYGKGDIRGLIAAEVPDNASQIGDLIPTLAFGIPGGEGTAMMLGLFLIHGITPGPELLTTRLPLVFVIVLTALLGNVLAGAISTGVGGLLGMVTRVPRSILVPSVVCLSLWGAFAFRQEIGDVLTACLFGALAAVMSRFDLPKAPMVIGFILGPLAERAFYRTVQLGRGEFWSVVIQKPIALGFLVVTVVTLLLPYLYRLRRAPRGA